MSHKTPLDDAMSHKTPLDDAMSHKTPLDDAMSHKTPFICSIYFVPNEFQSNNSFCISVVFIWICFVNRRMSGCVCCCITFANYQF